jgi:hypothetical protein
MVHQLERLVLPTGFFTAVVVAKDLVTPDDIFHGISTWKASLHYVGVVGEASREKLHTGESAVRRENFEQVVGDFYWKVVERARGHR